MGARRRWRTSHDREWALLVPWELLFVPLVPIPLGAAVAVTAALALLAAWLIVRAYSNKRRLDGK